MLRICCIRQYLDKHSHNNVAAYVWCPILDMSRLVFAMRLQYQDSLCKTSSEPNGTLQLDTGSVVVTAAIFGGLGA